MRRPRVGVIDYEMGNLHSVAKALSLQGGRVFVSKNRNRLKNCDLLVLPGVGSFGAAVKALRKRKLDTFIRSWVRKKKPYLGICLGFQLLFERSQEDPGVPGLGLLKGSVVRFKRKVRGRSLVVPHMGWNTAERKKGKGRKLFKGISQRDRFYYVHTFFPKPKDSSVEITRTQYGQPFCSAVARENLFASQFHPEKSGRVGLRLLKNILGNVARQG